MFCSQCGCENQNHAKFCTQCGTALTPTVPFAQVTTPPKIEQSLSVDEEFGLVVGKATYQDYFKNKWFEQGRPANLQDKYLKKSSFNLAGFLFGFLYMGYRKMYFELTCYFAVIAVLDIIIMYIMDKESVFLWIATLASVGTSVNMIYYNFCKKKIERLREIGYDTQTYREKLAEQGGTSVAGIFIGLFIVFGVSIILYGLFAPDWYWSE